MAEILRPVPADARDTTRVGAFMNWLEAERGLRLTDWDDLHRWSVEDIEGFWKAIWDHFGVVTHRPYEQVLEARTMPGAKWFTGAQINYAEHSLGTDADLDTVAVVARSQTRDDVEMTFGRLRDRKSVV